MVHTVRGWGKTGWTVKEGDAPGGAWRPGGRETIVRYIAKTVVLEAKAAARAAAAQQVVGAGQGAGQGEAGKIDYVFLTPSIHSVKKGLL